MTLSNPAQYISGRTVQEQMNSLIDYVDQRAADVALDAIVSDVAQVHLDMLDADVYATAAAASAAAAAGTLANAVKKTGEASQSIAGDIAVAGTLSGGVVTGTQVTVPTPVNNTDAATKKYVDDHHDNTKLDINDVNSYAVGLTGNQGPIAGIKSFEYIPAKSFVLKDTSSPGSSTWRRIYTCAASSSASNRNVTVLLVGTRYAQFDILTLNYGGLSGTGSSTLLLGNFSVRICRNTAGNIEIWTNGGVYGICLCDGLRTVGLATNCTPDLSAADTTEPTVGGDFSAVTTPTQVIS